MNTKTLIILAVLVTIAAVVLAIIFNNKFVVIGSRVYDASFLADRGLIPTELRSTTQSLTTTNPTV